MINEGLSMGELPHNKSTPNRVVASKGKSTRNNSTILPKWLIISGLGGITNEGVEFGNTQSDYRPVIKSL